MRIKAASALLAAIMLCGCTVTPQAEKNNSNKPVAREYKDDSVVSDEVLPAHIDPDNKEWENGGKLVHDDFSVGDDFNFLDNCVNDEQRVWTFVYWGAYDENDEKYRDLSFFLRTPYESTPYDIVECYGGKSIPASKDDDKLLQYAEFTKTEAFLLNAAHADHYFEHVFDF